MVRGAQELLNHQQLETDLLVNELHSQSAFLELTVP